MPLRELPPALLKKAVDEIGEVPSRIPDDIKAIKDWLAKQPHINANLDDQWILTFLRGCKFSLERTKEKLENYYTARSLAPELIMADDPADPTFRELFKLGSCYALKKPIAEDGICIFFMRPGLCDPAKYTIYQSMRMMNMLIEVLMLECDNLPIAGFIGVADMKNMTMGHFSQINPTLAKKMDLCGEKSLPVRHKGAHHLNTPSGIETVFNIVTKFMSEKLKSRMFLYSQNNLEEIYKHVPKESLPEEYGGNAGPISELVDFWEEKLLSHRDYFLKSREFKTDERKRVGKPKTAEELFGVEGSFRSLEVD